MKIERIYIACTRKDQRFTRCCVASIRYWYPEIPITLIEDELYGAVELEDLYAAWNVSRFETRRKLFGIGMSKLEVLFLPSRERCLYLDSDIVFLGKVLDELEKYDEDFIVAESFAPPERTKQNYFDLTRLNEHDPAFGAPEFLFNTGQLVATTGILRQSDFESLITFSEPAEQVHPDIFAVGEQGCLNYVLLKKWRQGELTLRRVVYMWWAGWLDESRVKIAELTQDSPYPVLVHWAGPKYKMFRLMRNGYLLQHFEQMYLDTTKTRVFAAEQ